MAYQDDIQNALANLIGSGGPATSSVRAGTLQFTPPPSMLEGTQTSNWINLPTAAQSQAGQAPWWAKSLERLSPIANAATGLGGVITNTLANWADGDLNWKDIPLAEQGRDYMKGAFAPLADGLQWSDIPAMTNPASIALRGFDEMGKNTKTTHDIFENLGWQEAEADPTEGWNFLDRRKNNLDYSDLLEFGGDVLLDPLTYLTFGAGSAVKAGTGAILKEGAKQLGVKALPKAVARKAGEVPEYVFKQVLKQTGDEAAATAARVATENAGKAARFTSQNAALSLDIPFTNYTKILKAKPTTSGFFVSDNLIGNVGADAIRARLAQIGITDAAQQTQLIQRAFGVDDPAKLTSQALEHFNQNIQRVAQGEDIIEVFKPVTDEMLTYEQYSPESILNFITSPEERKFAQNLYQTLADSAHPTSPRILGNPSTSLFPDLGKVRQGMAEGLANRAEDIFQFASEAPGMHPNALDDLDRLLRTSDFFRQAPDDLIAHAGKIEFAPFERATANVPNATKTADNFSDVFDLYRFQQDMGGTSPVSRWLTEQSFLRHFNPRILNPKGLSKAERQAYDPFTRQQGARIADADTQVRGNLTQMGREMSQLENMLKGLSPDEVRKLTYIVEGEFPGGQTLDQFLAGVSPANREKLMQASQYAKQMFGRMAMREQNAGALQGVIENYFPHVMQGSNLTTDQAAEILKNSTLRKYLGRDATNRFDQARKGPRSFAAWDDIITELEDALPNVKPDDLDEFTKKLDQVKGLFERDPIKATASRYRKNVYASAMTELYTDLHKNGMILTAEDIASLGRKVPNANVFRPIDDALKKKLHIKGLENGGYIHKDVAAGLQKVDKLFGDVEFLNNVADGLISVTNIWKSIVTTPIPSHHFNNFVGNMLNNMFAGVGVQDYSRARNLMKKIKAGTLSDAEQRLVQEMYDRGVLASGMIYEMDDPFRLARAQEKGWLGQLEARTAKNPLGVGRWMRSAVGDNVEDFTRMALYLKGKRSGLSARQSGDLVRQYLFNYGERTQADEIMRLGAPFWSWTKSNLPLQFMELLRQPRFHTAYRHLQSLTDDQSNSAKPEWVGDYLKIPGTDQYINPRAPQQDLTNLLKDPLRFGLNTLSPAIKVPFEVVQNKQIFNDRMIDPSFEYSGVPDPTAWAKYAAGQTGLPGRMVNAFQSEDPLSSLLRIVLPMWPQTVDQNRTIEAQQQELKARQRAGR